MNPNNPPSSPKKQRGRPRKNLSSESVFVSPSEKIETLTETCIKTLQTALQQTQKLAQEQYQQKRSNHRICNVNRELKELLKVMTRYRKL